MAGGAVGAKQKKDVLAMQNHVAEIFVFRTNSGHEFRCTQHDGFIVR
jgi:hypothetical protein